MNLNEKEIWLLDSLIGLYEDDAYFKKLLPLKVFLPQWLASIGFYKTREEKRLNACWLSKR